MRTLYLTLMMLTACSSQTSKPQDLSGKAFVFAREGSTEVVKLTSPKDGLTAVTVCMRVFTDLTRNHALFSLATPSKANAFLLFYMHRDANGDQMEIIVQNTVKYYPGLSYKRNDWQSVCSTWRADTGVGQVWMDGQPSVPKFIQTGPITGKPIIILGQDQDSYGGKFQESQSFSGMMSDVHMWSRVLSPCEIESYSKGQNLPEQTSGLRGDLINWAALEYQISGNVLVEYKPKCGMLL